jgi:hypothetical protein
LKIKKERKKGGESKTGAARRQRKKPRGQDEGKKENC